MTVHLRQATLEDAELLKAWRNDPETRRFAFSSAPVDDVEHARWLRQSLSSPHRRIWIAETANRPVGQVRLDHLPAEDVAAVDIAVAPDRRGEGHAVSMLLMVGEREPWGVPVLRAEVMPANAASLSAFRKAGFGIAEHDSRRVVLERTLRRRPDRVV